jgi:putative ABC transport system substrate-binding protein
MRRLGYVDGQSMTVFQRSADGDFARLPGLAKELAALRVDVIVSHVTQASLAAKKATASIPVVMVAVSDPVGSGLVQSLARPGGNVTGTSAGVGGVVGKQLELLHQLRPDAFRVAVLWNPANPVFQQQQLRELGTAARKLHLQAELFEARTPAQLDGTFARIAGERHALLLTLGDPMYTAQAKRIADLALAHKLVAVSGTRAYADAGFVAAYGPDFSDAYRRAASYVDRILRGARPSDLPVEQSAKFELVVNMKTARMLAITIPPSITARADQVIE